MKDGYLIRLEKTNDPNLVRYISISNAGDGSFQINKQWYGLVKDKSEAYITFDMRQLKLITSYLESPKEQSFWKCTIPRYKEVVSPTWCIELNL